MNYKNDYLCNLYDNSVVGLGAVACKDYKESNVVIVGNPGKIVKRNITWNRQNSYHLEIKQNNSREYKNDCQA